MSSGFEREKNDASVWRAFENNPLSHSMAHYLMAIDCLRDDLGYARSTDVSGMLGVSRGAASMALSQLKKRGWVTEDPNRFLLLTSEGQGIVDQVENNFCVLHHFFEEILGIEHETAAADACKMEHLMSMETGRRLLALMQWLMQDKAEADRVRTALAAQREKAADG